MSSANVLFDAPGPRARRIHLIGSIIGAVIIAGVIAWMVWTLWNLNQITPQRWEPILGAEAWRFYLLPGIRATILAAIFSITIAFVIAFVAAMCRMAESPFLRWPATIFIEFFRAVPVLIMMIFALTFVTQYTPVPTPQRPLVAVIIGLVFYNGAVMAEVIRNGVASLPSGQREAGLSIGLNPTQVRRMILVPQALTAMLPALVSQMVVALKDSALGYIILYPELLNSARQMGTRFGNTTVAFITAAVLFILINYAVTMLAEYLERRVRERGGKPTKKPAAGVVTMDATSTR
ncbi:amino acid ABC transporter permease [Ornithinimicrobium sp. Y1694]|uniref:amino acid ABC transporter permease n=1 Tax=Ornithinimicrobium sp. Y1694 TaxID=3418590 RepID=UPI003CF04A96